MYPLSKNNERVDSDTLDTKEFWNEMDKISSILEADLDDITFHLNSSDKQVWRRVFCRTLFSYIEGQTYFLRQLFLFYDWWTVDEDIEFKIRNQKIIRKKGKEEIVNSYLPLIENIKLVFDVIAKASGSEQISKNGSDWEKFSKAIKTRNRIVHPKSSEELIILR